MNAKEIVGMLRVQKPAVLGKMSDKKAAALIRNALLLLGEKIDATQDGVVKVRGLGNFRVKQVGKATGAAKPTARRVTFRPTPKKK